MMGPDLEALLQIFPTADDFDSLEEVAPDAVPPPYHGLLVHEHHMTVTVESFHRDRVNVRILDQQLQGDSYARRILLALQGSGQIVQYGIVLINFRFCSAEVREEILAGQIPLGRILIEHDVLRRIQPTAYLRVVPGSALRNWFGLTKPLPTYGRLAYIYCNEQPAIELLEVVAPAGIDLDVS